MPDEPADAERPSIGPTLQLKVRLLEVSPMVWRRLLVPAAASLRELHGIIQVAMGWAGIHLFQFHLRAVRYGSPELSASSPEVALESFRLRRGNRFTYEYDLNVPWRHEVRVERHIEPEAGSPCPLCLAGHGDCPAEDSGCRCRDQAGADRRATSRGSMRLWASRPCAISVP
ncbi:MAG TPA: plasmid pRiA4b ORF-3 family protein [Geminicoccaceae bacterium]|nr:plasmid pRiA4b ORF-3 family protein [Geminicoccaceae bacterium]